VLAVVAMIGVSLPRPRAAATGAAIGGWSADPVPDLQQFIAEVHAGKVSHYVETGKGALSRRGHSEPNHSTSHAREIADWVAAHYRGTKVGGSTVYRLI
jgi:hypothetical protein